MIYRVNVYVTIGRLIAQIAITIHSRNNLY